MSREGTYNHPKRQIGFTQDRLTIRTEEGGDLSRDDAKIVSGAAYWQVYIANVARIRRATPRYPAAAEEINSLDKEKLTVRDKIKLLEENRQFLAVLHGGSPYKFGTEKVIYSILIFSAVVIIILACLNVIPQRPLPLEVTVTFVVPTLEAILQQSSRNWARLVETPRRAVSISRDRIPAVNIDLFTMKIAC